jgi:tetratricopeptide (TPR) repeat protein
MPLARVAYSRESLALYRQHGDERGAAWVLIDLAWLASDLNYIGAGRRFLAEAFQLCERNGDRYGISRALNLLGLLTWQGGDYEAAFPLHQRSLAISRELGDRWGTAWALHRISVAHLTLVRLGHREVLPVIPLIEEALSIWLGLGERRHFAFSLSDRGCAAAFDGRPDDARAALGQSLAIFTELGDRHGTGYVLAVYAYICIAERQPEQALRVVAAWLAYGEARRGVRRLWPPVVREFVQRAEFEVRAAHGEAAVATAWEKGRTMSLEEAVAYVEGRGGR